MEAKTTNTNRRFPDTGVQVYPPCATCSWWDESSASSHAKRLRNTKPDCCGARWTEKKNHKTRSRRTVPAVRYRGRHIHRVRLAIGWANNLFVHPSRGLRRDLQREVHYERKLSACMLSLLVVFLVCIMQNGVPEDTATSILRGERVTMQIDDIRESRWSLNYS